MSEENEYDDEEDLGPSKSQLKRDAHALVKLGTALTNIPEAAWRKLELPENLIQALRESAKIKAHGATKRHMHYIGKLMRNIDCEPIDKYFEKERLKNRIQIQQHHQLEQWRDRMIEESDEVIEEFVQKYPLADRQRIRSLIRQARKEIEKKASPKSSRVLFKYLREVAEAEK